MILRCAACTNSVDVGDGDTPTWHLPLWDHLLDEHRDEIALGHQGTIQFRGPRGVIAYVREPAA